jgi:type VI secretion system protein ImpC
MPRHLSRSSVRLDVNPAGSSESNPIEADPPFRILVLGDFSGRTNRGVHSSLGGRRAIRVDCDNFDAVLEQMGPTLRLGGSVLEFRELEDFHPDHIHRNTAIFRKLAEMREEPIPGRVPPAAAAQASVAGLLDDIIAKAEGQAGPPPEAAGDLAAFIDRVLAPHLERPPDPGRRDWEARIDAAVSEQMQAILHHPDFQALEASWRAVWMLLQGLGAEPGIEIHVFDATLAELLEQPDQAEELIGSRRNRWALIAGNFVFGQNQEDAGRLRALGRMARSAGAPFLAEAHPASESAAPEQWEELRRSAEACWIGLAVPRFLLRLPYGKATAPVESFAFEEMPESNHPWYLWGNPAFCCALLIAQAFRTHGWDLYPGIHRRIEGLPLHVYEADGESVTKPCAEIWLTEKDAEFLLDRGFMPLASLKNQDAVLLVRFQSIADPPAPLGGRWQPRGVTVR